MKKVSFLILILVSINSYALEYLTINVTESSGPGWSIAWYSQFKEYSTDDHRIVQLAFSPYNNKFSLYELDKGKTYDYNTSSWVVDTVAIQHINTNAPYLGIRHDDQYLNALKELTIKAVTKYNPRHLTLKYNGHGSGWANLYGGFISGKENVQDYLQGVVDALGKKIDILDWNTNCNVLSMEQLEAHMGYADYFIASEFERGGFSFNSTYADGSTVDFGDDIIPIREMSYYLSLFSFGKTPEEISKEIISKQKYYWDFEPVQTDITRLKLKQTLYLIDLAKFEKFYNALDLPASNYRGQDVLEVVQSLDPTSEQNYHDMILASETNKSYFTWGSDENGVTFDATSRGRTRTWGLGLDDSTVSIAVINPYGEMNSSYQIFNANGQFIQAGSGEPNKLFLNKGRYYVQRSNGVSSSLIKD